MMPAMIDQLPPRLTDLTREMVQRAAVTDYVRMLSCLAQRPGPESAAELFAEKFPRAIHKDLVVKTLSTWYERAAVLPGDTVNPSWAGALVSVTPLAEAFLALVRSASLLGRIANFVT